MNHGTALAFCMFKAFFSLAYVPYYRGEHHKTDRIFFVNLA